jgi:hypothetical protein
MNRAPLLLLLPLFLFTTTAVQAGKSNEESLTLQNSGQPHTTNVSEMLRDIHGPLPTSDYPPYLVGTALFLLLLLLFVFLFYLLKRRKKPQPTPIPAWEKALQELAEARQLMQSGQSLLYMHQVAQILRHYIEMRFSIRSTRQTTREFFAGLKAFGHPDLVQYQEELRICLEQADLAKFAHLTADQSHMQQMEEAIRIFISSTRPEMPAGGGKS